MAFHSSFSQKALLGFLLFSCHLTALTLHSCKEIALDQNPAIRAAKEGVKIACEGVGKANAAYYPELNFTASYARWQTHAFIPTQLQQYPQFMFSRYGPFDDYRVSFGARFLLFDFGRRNAELKSALAKSRGAEFEKVKIKQEIAMNVSFAFYSLAANLEMLKVHELKLERAKKHLDLAEKRKETGSVPALDVFRAKVGVADAKQELTKITGLVRIARGNLNIAMGIAPNLSLEIEPEEGEVENPESIDIDGVFAIGLQKRPEMQASNYYLEATYQEIKKARSEFGPKVALDGAYGWRDESFFPRTREFYAGVGLQWNLFNGYFSTHSLRQAKHEYQNQMDRQEQLALTVQQEIWRAHSQLIETWEMIETTKAQVHDAVESLRLAKGRYENGSATINDLLDSETALAKSEALHVEARWNFKIAESFFLWTQGVL